MKPTLTVFAALRQAPPAALHALDLPPRVANRLLVGDGKEAKERRGRQSAGERLDTPLGRSMLAGWGDRLGFQPGTSAA